MVQKGENVVYFPFVDLVEKLLDWAKNFGSPLYWVWIAVPSIVGGVAFSQILAGASWSETKPIWILTAVVFIIPSPFIFWHEQEWKKNNK